MEIIDVNFFVFPSETHKKLNAVGDIMKILKHGLKIKGEKENIPVCVGSLPHTLMVSTTSLSSSMKKCHDPVLMLLMLRSQNISLTHPQKWTDDVGSNTICRISKDLESALCSCQHLWEMQIGQDSQSKHFLSAENYHSAAPHVDHKDGQLFHLEA